MTLAIWLVLGSTNRFKDLGFRTATKLDKKYMILVLVKHPVLDLTFFIRKEAVARKRHLWMTSWLLSVTSLYVFCDSFVFHYILTMPVDFGFIFPLPSSIHKWYMTFGLRRMAQSHFDKVVQCFIQVFTTVGLFLDLDYLSISVKPEERDPGHSESFDSFLYPREIVKDSGS